MVQKWATESRRGKEGVEDYERSGRPEGATTSKNVESVNSLIMSDRRMLHDISRQISICFWDRQSILIDILGMSKVSARWVPRMLIKDQKKSRLDISKYLLSVYENDPEESMRRVVIQDEALAHHFDPGAKSRPCNGSTLAHPPKKFKVMASIFWDSQNAVMVNYHEEGRTINGAYYAEELRWLRQEIVVKKKRKIYPRCSALARKCTSTNLLLLWLLRLNAASRSFIILRILQV